MLSESCNAGHEAAVALQLLCADDTSCQACSLTSTKPCCLLDSQVGAQYAADYIFQALQSRLHLQHTKVRDIQGCTVDCRLLKASADVVSHCINLKHNQLCPRDCKATQQHRLTVALRENYAETILAIYNPIS